MEGSEARKESEGLLVAPTDTLPFPVQHRSEEWGCRSRGLGACSLVIWLRGSEGCVRPQGRWPQRHAWGSFILALGQAPSAHRWHFLPELLVSSLQMCASGLVCLCPPVWVLVPYFQTEGLTLSHEAGDVVRGRRAQRKGGGLLRENVEPESKGCLLCNFMPSKQTTPKARIATHVNTQNCKTLLED